MKITDELVQHLEELARIELMPEERKKCCEDLQNIISYMDILNELNTEKLELSPHFAEPINIMREDVVKPSVDREEVLKNAPKSKDGYFSVPKTLE